MEPITMTVEEISHEMHVSKDKVREWARWSINPLPLRILPDMERGAFVMKDEFESWLRKASIRFVDKKLYKKGEKSG